MPRKKRSLKNPYCKRSRLKKHEFEALVNTYFAEITGLQTRKDTQFGYALIAWTKGRGKGYKRLSLQAISYYFKKMGQCIWERFVLEWNPEFENLDVFNDLLSLIYEEKEAVSSHYKEFYNSLNKSPLFINAHKIKRSIVFYLLSSRSKVIKGFKKDSFYLEFSRIFFLCLTMSNEDIKFISIYDSTLPEERDTLPDNPFEGKQFLPLNVSVRASRFFLDTLKQNPM